MTNHTHPHTKVPAGCAPLRYVWCCDDDDALDQPQHHIIGVSYIANQPFEVDGIRYTPRRSMGQETVTRRPMFELFAE